MNFKEKQSMKKLWGLMVTIAMLIIFFVWLNKVDTAEKKEALLALIVLTVVGLSLALVFISISLHTTITVKGIFFRYKPFSKEKHFTWAEIETVSVGNYKPVKEKSLLANKNPNKEIAYFVRGNAGLKINFRNGKSIIIGTQKETEMALFLKRLKEKYDIQEIGEAELNG